MPAFLCATCGAGFPPTATPPEHCPICEDPRQYVPPSGQRWTTVEELGAGHHAFLRDDHGLTAVGIEPRFAIGQRALFVPWGAGQLLWDCVPLLDDETATEIEGRGGVDAIAISHPHYYGGMVDWARRFDCPILLHADDREWITRPDPAIELWDGETRELGHGLTLVRCGGHFAGATVLHRAADATGAGATPSLLSGDVVQVIPDRRHVSFMYSYPNDIPLSAADVEAIGRTLEAYAFERIHGAWWDAVVEQDGKGAVERSVARYGPALEGDYPVGDER